MLPTPESLGLPSKPVAAVTSSTPSDPKPSSSSSTPASTTTTTTKPDPAVCAHCPTAPKYTCPRCATRTCSLPCSKLHKSSTGCSGVRDPAAFVPLNKIKQGTWDADYAFLEERRRQVAAWGEGVTPDEAARVGLDNNSRGGKAGRGGKVQVQNRQKKSKLDGLRWAVTEIGGDVDILPDGMARRRTNQSSWNPKSRSLNLTIQFHVPPHNDDPTLLSHPRVAVLPRADPPLTLRSLLPERLCEQDVVMAVPYHVPRWRVRQCERTERNERRRGENAAVAETDAAATTNTTLAATPGRKFFPPLDPAAPLDAVFAGTVWIEFPSVHVFPRAEWEAMDKVVMPPFVSDNKRKREGGEGGDGKRANVGGEGDNQGAGTSTAKSVPLPGGIAALGDYESDDEVDDAIDAEDGEEGGDIELTPEMAAALGKALVADFGEA